MRLFILLTFFLMCFPLISVAGSAAPGPLSDVYVMSNGKAIIYTTGSRSSPPACATQVPRFAIDATTPTGKAQLATLLTAFASGKTVEFSGTGTCGNWGDTESVDYLRVLP